MPDVCPRMALIGGAAQITDIGCPYDLALYPDDFKLNPSY